MINQDTAFLTDDGLTIFASTSLPAIPWNIGVVIVPSFGYEHTCAYESLRTLGERLVGVGCGVVRFDPAGRRSSPPRDRSGLREWAASTALAAAHLRGLGATRLVIVGHRLGALVLPEAVEPAPDAVVAIDPVVSGRRFLRELQVLQFMGVGAELSTDGGLVVLGERLGAAERDELNACDLTRLVPPARALIVHRGAHEAAARLTEHWHAEVFADDDIAAMIERGAENALTPTATVERVVTWITDEIAGPRQLRPGAAPAGVEPGATQVRRITDADLGTVVERIERIGAPRLHAVSVSPTEPVGCGPSVLFVGNGGQQEHGPAGSWTRWSRLFAAAGTPTMRACVRGRGESERTSEPPPGHPDDRFYRWEHVEDVARAAHHLLALTDSPTEVACVGLCSSAFLALDAANIEPSIRRVVAISPQLDFLPAGPRSVRRKRAGRPAALGVTQWLRSTDGLGEKLGRRMPVSAWRLLVGARLVPSPAVAPLRAADAGVEVLIVAPADEFPAILPRSGRLADRLSAHPRIRVWSPTGMDHSMFDSGVREQVEAAVAAFVRGGVTGFDDLRQMAPTAAASNDGHAGASHSALTARS